VPMTIIILSDRTPRSMIGYIGICLSVRLCVTVHFGKMIHPVILYSKTV